MIGIPFAQPEQEPSGSWVKVCPVCGDRIAVVERKDFESFTGREYAEHYQAAHAEREDA